LTAVPIIRGSEDLFNKHPGGLVNVPRKELPTAASKGGHSAFNL
jgi:hypothetical protein